MSNPRDQLIEQFLAGDGRQRRALLVELRTGLTQGELGRLAPALRDATPKISARLVSLLARAGLSEVFEAQLAAIKPARVIQMRAQFQRISQAAGSRPTEAPPEA